MVVVGSAMMGTYLGWRAYQTTILSFDNRVLANQEFVRSSSDLPKPVKISIPKVNLELGVEENTIIDGTWEISETGASHLDNSANPGEEGNVVIYAHNKTNLFGPIRWLSLGETVLVTTEDGQDHTYEIVESVVVDPDRIEYVLPKDEETLTLYTCTNFFDKDRHIVVAKPVE